MVGFGNSLCLDKDKKQILSNYCAITHRANELQLICAHEGSILAWCYEPTIENCWIADNQIASNRIQELFTNASDLLSSGQVCSLRTKLKPSKHFHRTIHLESQNGIPELDAKVHPVYTSSQPSEWINVSVKLAPSEKPVDTRVTGLPKLPYATLEPSTGLFLEAYHGFAELIGLTEAKLLHARIEEIGLHELRINGMLNADRGCMFSASLNPQFSGKQWVISENVKLLDRDCLRIWCVQKETASVPSIQLSQMANDFNSTWQNKPDCVLIADDNPLLANTCASILEWAGIDYLIVANGKDALNMIETRPIDAILMDLNMPRLNGFDTAKMIRKAQRPYSSVPIVAMTATPGSALDLDRQLANFDSFLQKPFDIEDLKEAVETAMLVKLLPTELSQSNSPYQSTLEHLHYSLEYVPTSFMDTFRGDKKRLEAIRQDVINALDSSLDSMTSAAQGRLDQKFKTEIQRFQSMAVTIGACRLATLSKTLLENLESPESRQADDIRVELTRGIEEAIIFYKKVDWDKFILLKSADPVNVA
jgi:CheY-like chemotaxis protein